MRSPADIMEDGCRAGLEHSSAKPRKLSGVLVSVGYSFALSETLPKNIGQFDELAIVTSSEDTRTQDLVKRFGGILVVSDRCYDDSHSFNKGRMLNDGLAALNDPDWIILTDADIIFNDRTRAFILSHSLNPGCLYFTGRHDRTPVLGQSDDVNMEPNGYFQLFNPRAAATRNRWPKLVCEEFCSAGSVDSWFFQQWDRDKLMAIPELDVHHLSSQRIGENWNGLESKNNKWRQWGILTVHGFSTFLQGNKLPDVIKLTDTRYGQSIVTETKNFDTHVRLVATGLEFLGKEIGGCHIHVAYKE
ncbi:MAG: hypothetical protein ACLPX9_19270 [Rhodomicrobium sp.]